MEDTGRVLSRRLIGLAFVLLIVAPGLALGQCPNNCTGHGECVPSEKNRRFLCECHDGWTGQACSQRVSVRAKAKEPPEELILEEPEELAAVDDSQRDRPRGGTRELDEVTRYRWTRLSGFEQKLLTDLGWEEATWNTKASPRTPWPNAMRTPYNALDTIEQAAVKAFRLTPRDWNTGKHLALLMHPTD